MSPGFRTDIRTDEHSEVGGNSLRRRDTDLEAGQFGNVDASPCRFHAVINSGILKSGGQNEKISTKADSESSGRGHKGQASAADLEVSRRRENDGARYRSAVRGHSDSGRDAASSAEPSPRLVNEEGFESRSDQAIARRYG